MLMKKSVTLVLFVILSVSLIYFVHAAGELAKVPEAGQEVCVFHCNEDLQRCAPGCPCYYTKSDGTCGTREEANQELENQESEYGVVPVSDEELHEYGDFMFPGECFKEVPRVTWDNGMWSCSDIFNNDPRWKEYGCDEYDKKLDACEIAKAKEEVNKCLNNCPHTNGCLWNGGCIEKDQQERATRQTNQQTSQQTGTVPSAEQQIKDDYESLSAKAKEATVSSVVDFDGRQVQPIKDKDYVKINVQIQGVTYGQPVKVIPPEGFTVDEIILKPYGKIDSGGITIEGTIPKLLRGPSPRALPADDLPPVPSKDNVLYYLSIKDTVETQHVIFEEALFKWKVKAEVKPVRSINYDTSSGPYQDKPIGGEYGPINIKYKMLHYVEADNQWQTLPTVLDWCDKNGYCNYITDPSVGGYYAIVEEKIDSSKYHFGQLALIIIGWLVVLFLYLKLRNKETYNEIKSAKTFGKRIVLLKNIGVKKFMFNIGAFYFGILSTIIFAIVISTTGIIDTTSIKFILLGGILSLIGMYIILAIYGAILGLIIWLVLLILSKIFKE
jgi:hypothetical protein